MLIDIRVFQDPDNEGRWSWAVDVDGKQAARPDVDLDTEKQARRAVVRAVSQLIYDEGGGR